QVRMLEDMNPRGTSSIYLLTDSISSTIDCVYRLNSASASTPISLQQAVKWYKTLPTEWEQESEDVSVLIKLLTE
mgnify:CR=1